MTFLRLPLASLAGRPFRTALTATGIALAVASFLALVGLSRGVERAWSRSLQERGTDVLAVSRGAVEILTGSLDEELAAQIAAVPGVRDATGELIDLLTLEEWETVLVAGWPIASPLWQSLQLTAGRLPDPARPREILIGRHLASAMGRAPGDPVRIWGGRYEVAGVFTQGDVIGDSTIVARLTPLQELLGRPGKVTLFHLRLDRPGDAAAARPVLADLAGRFPALSFTETGEVARDNQVLRLLRAVAWSVSAVALLMGAFFILNTLLMAVGERTREVGVLVAVGWSDARILALVLIEGLLLALAGGLAGAALGLAGLEWLSRLPHLRGFVDPEISPRLLGEVLGATLLLGLAGGLYPAWRALRLAVVDALRHE
ncbi:MAG TPA: ABC transporter permease [Thermoanaerobaculia bacterium]|nr:ABC transporter permease [Thermoanaerobaculia bacterium]